MKLLDHVLRFSPGADQIAIDMLQVDQLPLMARRPKRWPFG
jgi:hypothetical protein